MVTPDTRNNIMTLAAIVAIAILITAFIYIFSSSLIQVAQHGEQTLNIIGKSVAGNVSKAADVNQLNLKQFNQSMADVIQSNDRIVSSNKQSITNLSTIVQNFSKINTKYLGEVDNNITSNNKLLQQLYCDTHCHTRNTPEHIQTTGHDDDSHQPLVTHHLPSHTNNTFTTSFLLDSLIPFLQVVLDNATTTLAPQLAQTVAATTNQLDATSNGLIATAITVAGGVLGKHLYDNKKRNETIAVASDIDKIQMSELADNYNDFAQQAAIMEDMMRLIIQNPDTKISDILNLVVDDVTKETMGMRLVTFYQNIQKYNQEYYKNTAIKPNSMLNTTNNPLKNVRNLVRDMSTPTPS